MITEKMLEYLMLEKILESYSLTLEPKYDLEKIKIRKNNLLKEYLENYAKHN